MSLITLHYSEEILPHENIASEDGKIESEEKSHMKKIIKEMTDDFIPDKYADERRKKILKLLRKKLKEKATVEAPAVEEQEGGGPVDLIAVLEESMRKVKENR